MATFPTLPVSQETLVDTESGLEMAPAESGAGRGEALYDAPQFRVELVFQWLTRAERDELVDFVFANLESANDIDFGGYTYSLRLLPDGGPSETHQGPWVTVRLGMRGTRAPIAE